MSFTKNKIFIGYRLKQYLDETGITIRRLERACGFNNAYFRTMKFCLPADRINRVCAALPRLNREWLISGNGNMINTETNVSSIEEPVFLDNIPERKFPNPVINNDVKSFHVKIQLEGIFEADVLAMSENDAILSVRRMMYKMPSIKLCKHIGLHETDIKTEILNKNETSSE